MKLCFHPANNKSQTQHTSGGQCLIPSHSCLMQVVVCPIGWVRHDENRRRFQRCAEMFPMGRGFHRGTPEASFCLGAEIIKGPHGRAAGQGLAARACPTAPVRSSGGHRGSPSPGHWAPPCLAGLKWGPGQGRWGGPRGGF